MRSVSVADNAAVDRPGEGVERSEAEISPRFRCPSRPAGAWRRRAGDRPPPSCSRRLPPTRRRHRYSGPGWGRTRCQELNLSDLGCVPLAPAEMQNPRIPAGALGKPRRNRAEQLAGDPLVGDITSHQPARVQGAGSLRAILDPALGQRDQALDERTQLLRLGQGRIDPPVAQQHLGLIAQRGESMFGHTTQFPVRYSMTHGFRFPLVHPRDRDAGNPLLDQPRQSAPAAPLAAQPAFRNPRRSTAQTPGLPGRRRAPADRTASRDRAPSAAVFP